MTDEIREYIDAAATAAATKARNEFEIIVEGLEAKIATVAEGHAAILRSVNDGRSELRQDLGELRTEAQQGFREVMLASRCPWPS